MKGMKSIILIILVLAFLALSVNFASADVNVYVNATVPGGVLYQNGTVSANVTVTNNENFLVRIYSIGAHYDWMQGNGLTSVDLGGNYLEIQPNGTAMPGQLIISCDNNVSTGWHTFYYSVVLNWYNSYAGTWVNDTVTQPGTIFVESPLQPQALQQLQFANTTLASAQNANFSSASAISDVNNAADLLNAGWSAYYTNDYPTAINDSSNVISLVADAKVRQNNYNANVSQIQLVVAQVNQKLGSITGTTSPDVENAVGLAVADLNQTKQYIDTEDFSDALTYANMADHEADNAVNLQYYASLQANQTAGDKNSAQAALLAAQASLNNVTSLTSTAAQSLIDNARQKLTDATSLFNSGDYENATISANAVVQIVGQANSQEANYLIIQAQSKITSVGTPNSPDGKTLLAQANDELNQSLSDYTANDYQDADSSANLAYSLANQSAAAEQTWKSQHPLTNVTPGFGVFAALLAIAAIFILKERKA